MTEFLNPTRTCERCGGQTVNRHVIHCADCCGPTQDEIAERAAEIRAEWTDEEYRRRASADVLSVAWELPVVKMPVVDPP